MDAEKRKTIVREIEHWRRSKLLPEQYCDFLLNLYLYDPKDRPADIMGLSSSSIRNSSLKIWVLVFGSITLFLYVLLNFNSFSVPLQIGVTLFVVGACYVAGLMLKERRRVASFACMGGGSALLLLAGEYLLKQHDITESIWLLGYVAFCCMVWLMIGISTKIGVLQFSGWMGLLLIYGAVVHERMDGTDWLVTQMYWVPLGIIFCWIGWLMKHKDKKTGGVFFVIGSLLWFMPEIFALWVRNEETTIAWVEISLLGKMMATGALLFALRNKWTEWVV